MRAGHVARRTTTLRDVCCTSRRPRRPRQPFVLITCDTSRYAETLPQAEPRRTYVCAHVRTYSRECCVNPSARITCSTEHARTQLRTVFRGRLANFSAAFCVSPLLSRVPLLFLSLFRALLPSPPRRKLSLSFSFSLSLVSCKHARTHTPWNLQPRQQESAPHCSAVSLARPLEPHRSYVSVVARRRSVVFGFEASRLENL